MKALKHTTELRKQKESRKRTKIRVGGKDERVGEGNKVTRKRRIQGFMTQEPLKSRRKKDGARSNKKKINEADG